MLSTFVFRFRHLLLRLSSLSLSASCVVLGLFVLVWHICPLSEGSKLRTARGEKTNLIAYMEKSWLKGEREWSREGRINGDCRAHCQGLKHAQTGFPERSLYQSYGFFFLVGNSEALEINSRGPAGSDGHAFLSSLTLTSVSDGQRKLTHPDLRLRRTEKSFLVTVEIQAGAIAFAKVN